MATSRKGLKLMLAGLIVIIAGYILLAGGASADPKVFSYDIFDWRRLVAAPVVVLVGIAVVIVSIIGDFRDKEGK